jgi:hypothetical protein
VFRNIGSLVREYNQIWSALLLFYANVIARIAEWVWQAIRGQ